MSRFIGFLVAALVATTVLPSAWGIDNPGRERREKRATNALNDGVAALKQDQLDQAIASFTTAIESGSALNNDQRNTAIYGRGFAYFLKKDCPNAMIDLDKLAEARAEDGQYHFIRFVCLDQAGDKATAAAALEKAISLSPDNLDYLRSRCVLKFNAKDFTGGMPDCEKVVAGRADDAPIWQAIGQGSEILGQKEKALGAYRKLLALQPDNKIAQDGIKRLGG